MLNKDNNEKITKAQEEAQSNDELNGAMEELDDEVLDTLSGAGNPFASHPRVSTHRINKSVRNRG